MDYTSKNYAMDHPMHSYACMSDADFVLNVGLTFEKSDRSVGFLAQTGSCVSNFFLQDPNGEIHHTQL